MLPIIIIAILVLVGILIVEYFFLAETFTDTSGAEDLSGASTNTLLKILIDKFSEAVSSSSASTRIPAPASMEDTTSTDATEFKNSSDILSSIQQTIRNEFRQKHTFDDSILAPCSDNTVSACTLQGAEYSSGC